MHPPDRRLAGTHQPNRIAADADNDGDDAEVFETGARPDFRWHHAADRASGTLLLRLRAAAVKYIEFIFLAGIRFGEIVPAPLTAHYTPTSSITCPTSASMVRIRS